jgi:hypothetical protein
MSYCSPSVNIKDHYTCFEYDELKQIALAFNIYIQTNKVCPTLRRGSKKDKRCLPTSLIDIKKSKKKLWYSIYNRLKYICPYEYCWIDLDFINNIKDKYLGEKLRYFTFKPKITRTMNSWLSTKDIDNVLQQYQDLDPTFKFLGALPSDFYNLTHVDYSKIFDHKRIGIVFNLDTHNEPGSHWVSFLIDNKKKTLEYYDSAGRTPNKNIQTFIDRVDSYLKQHNLTYKTYYNTIKHQLQNNECGVYAIYFMIQRLLGKDFNEIIKNIVRDKEMNHFRQYIFRPK